MLVYSITDVQHLYELDWHHGRSLSHGPPQFMQTPRLVPISCPKENIKCVLKVSTPFVCALAFMDSLSVARTTYRKRSLEVEDSTEDGDNVVDLVLISPRLLCK